MNIPRRAGLGLAYLGMVAAGMFAALAISCLPLPADAATRVAGSYPQGSVKATAGSTFATASYADLPAATVTFVPQVDPNAGSTAGNISTDTIVVEFTADVIKATATTGTCAIWANGAIVADTARTIDFAAKQGTMTFVGAIANTTTGSQTVKVQCKSGDTNVFTVNTAYLRVVESY